MKASEEFIAKEKPTFFYSNYTHDSGFFKPIGKNEMSKNRKYIVQQSNFSFKFLALPEAHRLPTVMPELIDQGDGDYGLKCMVGKFE